MISWFAKNHVAANLLMITILLAGVFSIKSNIPLEVFPSFESDVVNNLAGLLGIDPSNIRVTNIV